MEKPYEQYTKQLGGSTMFHMSLGSKELFHSNFLHWISTINWDLFLKILHELTGIKNKFWWEVEDKFHPDHHNIEVRREFHHFDLSIYILDSTKEVDDSSVDSSTTNIDTEEYSYKEEKRVVQKWIPVLILENKMKSLPYRGQLVEYTNKAFNEWRTGSLIKEEMKKLKANLASASDWIAEHGITFILLSLQNTHFGQGFPKDLEVRQILKKKNSKEESPEFPFNWNHVTYSNLLAVLNTIEPHSFSENELDQLVFKNYTQFLESLCNLANDCWKINPQKSFRLQISPWVSLRTDDYKERIEEIEKYKKLRIHDIHEKLLYDQLLVLLEEKLGGRCARFDSKKNGERFNSKDNPIRIFTKSDYAHGVGIFEAQIWLFYSKNLKEHYLKLIIQVQGERYCHMVICDNVAKGAKRVNLNMISGLGKIINDVWKDSQWLDIKDPLSHYISITDLEPHFPFGIKADRWGKYGDNNLYQYIDIPQDKTIDEVIKAMVDDIDCIYKWYIR